MALIRTVGAQKPTQITVKEPSGTNLFQTSTSDDFVNVNDGHFESYDYVTYTVTSADNKTVTQKLDKISAWYLKKYPKGFCVANGDPNDHIGKIQFSNNNRHLGLNYVTVVLDDSDFQKDSDLILYEQGGQFDHTQPIQGTPAKRLDRTIRESWLTSPGDYKQRICLKLVIHFGKNFANTNNFTDRTLFYGTNDMQKRPDGSLAYQPINNNAVQPSLPSLASTVVKENTFRLIKGIFYRYQKAFEDGTIAYCNFAFTENAEYEYPLNYINVDGSYTEAFGDYHDEMIAQFKADFPEHSGLSKGDISLAVQQYGSIVSKKYRWTLGRSLARFDQYIIDKLHNELSNFKREKWHARDSGSFLDGNAYKRATYNVQTELHKRTILVKCNDLVGYDDSTLKAYYEHVASAAREWGAIAIVEPTAEGGDVNTPNNGTEQGNRAEQNRADVRRAINLAKGKVGISFIYQNNDRVTEFIQATGLASINTFTTKNEFKSVNGNQRLVQASVNLSNLYDTRGTDALKVAYANKLTSEQMSTVDLRIIDDVKPIITITTTPTPPPITTTVPQITTTVAPSGAIQPRIESIAYPDHINLSFVRSGKGWLVTDTSSPYVEPGYDLRYYVNNYWINLTTRMQNFFWPSDLPLSIIKGITKQGLGDDAYNKWECGSDLSYYDCNAARTFSYNKSFSFANVVFNKIG
jgi:hypothetical protein